MSTDKPTESTGRDGRTGFEDWLVDLGVLPVASTGGFEGEYTELHVHLGPPELPLDPSLLPHREQLLQAAIASRSPARGNLRVSNYRLKPSKSDDQGVDDEDADGEQRLPNAFLPLTTTEQVERRDAIKEKLQHKREALRQRSA